MGRVLFRNAKTRGAFFAEVKAVASPEGWKEFARRTGVPKSTLERYRNGELSLPSTRFEEMLEFLPKRRGEFYADGAIRRDDAWGRRKGGRATYSRHPNLFAKGRRKGLATIRSKSPKYEFDTGMALDEGLCELIGAFIGDGFTNRYGSSYTTQFTGHAKLDKRYYDDTIIPIIQTRFGINPRVSAKGNILRVTVYSKRLFQMLTRRFGFNAGKKVYTTKIPPEILQAKNRLLFAAVRGIFDTDGCLFIDKRPAYSRPYPRITLQTASEPLYNQLRKILGGRFRLYTSKRKNRRHYIEIYGHNQQNRWDKLVGFSNERHLPQ